MVQLDPCNWVDLTPKIGEKNKPFLRLILSSDTVFIFKVYANNGISAHGSVLMGLSGDSL